MKLCLNMIVRNEAANIERCLRSAEPYISAWVIHDTGSLDETPQIIERFFSESGIPGHLSIVPFTNFQDSRNSALRAAQRSDLDFDYLLLMDADMEFVVEIPAVLRTLSAPAYMVSQVNSITYYNTRLVRRDHKAVYQGVTHEYLVTEADRLHGVWFKDHADGSNRAGKFQRDIDLLQGALAKDPQDARSQFYLAQSLRDAGLFTQALEAYKSRVSMGGWDQEVWYSLLQIAAVIERMGDNPESAYMAAFNARPSRAEPLVELARFHRQRDQWASAMLYARAASVIPYPKEDVLFIDDSAYSWRPWDEIAICAWYVGAFEEGRQAAEKLHVLGFPESERARIEANTTFYQPKVAA